MREQQKAKHEYAFTHNFTHLLARTRAQLFIARQASETGGLLTSLPLLLAGEGKLVAIITRDVVLLGEVLGSHTHWRLWSQADDSETQ